MCPCIGFRQKKSLGEVRKICLIDSCFADRAKEGVDGGNRPVLIQHQLLCCLQTVLRAYFRHCNDERYRILPSGERQKLLNHMSYPTIHSGQEVRNDIFWAFVGICLTVVAMVSCYTVCKVKVLQPIKHLQRHFEFAQRILHLQFELRVYKGDHIWAGIALPLFLYGLG